MLRMIHFCFETNCVRGRMDFLEPVLPVGEFRNSSPWSWVIRNPSSINELIPAAATLWHLTGVWRRRTALHSSRVAPKGGQSFFSAASLEGQSFEWDKVICVLRRSTPTSLTARGLTKLNHPFYCDVSPPGLRVL